jgi:hypothetical protein
MTRTIPITSTLTLAAFLTAGWLAAPAPSQSAPANPVELGRVAWLRNYEAAAKQAKRTRKPVLLLFQEVPG